MYWIVRANKNSEKNKRFLEDKIWENADGYDKPQLADFTNKIQKNDILLLADSSYVGLAPFIVNGKPLKSINAWFNKRKAKYKHNQKINDYIHKTSRFIVDYCVENRIGTIIIGNNEGWKNSINIGK